MVEDVETNSIHGLDENFVEFTINILKTMLICAKINKINFIGQYIKIKGVKNHGKT